MWKRGSGVDFDLTADYLVYGEPPLCDRCGGSMNKELFGGDVAFCTDKKLDGTNYLHERTCAVYKDTYDTCDDCKMSAEGHRMREAGMPLSLAQGAL